MEDAGGTRRVACACARTVDQITGDQITGDQITGDQITGDQITSVLKSIPVYTGAQQQSAGQVHRWLVLTS